MHRLRTLASHLLAPHAPSLRLLTARSMSSVAGSSSRRFGVAAVQMTSGADMEANLAECAQQIRLAAKAGCRFIATPENTGRMTAQTQQANTSASASGAAAAAPPSTPSTPPAEFHPVLLGLQSLASELNVYILVGSLAVRVEGEQRFANRSFLLGPKAVKSVATPADAEADSDRDKHATAQSSSILGAYTKVHMFDVPSLNGSESYLESARVVPGSEAVVVDVPELGDVAIGMTICYDLRFPALYRRLAQAGANILVVPSAFTVVTGRAHWHALLRARAIETGCYVIAPAQAGVHPGDRRTYGHSLIVSPWGEVLADAGDETPTFISAEIDLDACDEARRRVPSLQHDRPFTIVKYTPTTA